MKYITYEQAVRQANSEGQNKLVRFLTFFGLSVMGGLIGISIAMHMSTPIKLINYDGEPLKVEIITWPAYAASSTMTTQGPARTSRFSVFCKEK